MRPKARTAQYARGGSTETDEAWRPTMTDRWTIRGAEFANCNCNWGCPCQFGAPTTFGHCEALVCGNVEQGNFNDTSLDGLNWALLLYWPGEIAQGNGKQQAIIDE